MRQQLAYTVGLFKLMSIPLLFFTICRLVFWALNHNYFSDVSPLAFVYGLRFDIAAIIIYFAAFIFFYLVPLPFRHHKLYQGWLKFLFHLALIPTLAVNLLDAEYFKFTLKRSTADFFQLISLGSDFQTLLPTFIKDYWYLIAVWIILVIAGERQYRKITIPQAKPNSWLTYGGSLLILTLLVGASVIGARGGLQLRPLKMINAGEYVESRHIPLVINTPFAIVNTLGKEPLRELHFYEEAEQERIYSPIVRLNNATDKPQKNVVLIILESFSREFIGSLNNNEGYTPFLDSLIGQSLTFEYCFANGKKSIESLPSIMAGLPSLMDNPYISSPYSANRVQGLAAVLREAGYQTTFYHGGTNGTMGFDIFAQTAGFESYYGRSEYNNEADFDGNWGIFDEPFLQHCAQQMNTTKPPFFSSIFTLSSHHPFTVPDQHVERFTEGTYPIHKTIEYADYSLQRFFKTASQMPWFNNTLFVLTADHTANSANPRYFTAVGSYAIPLIFFDPSGELTGQETVIAQQTDIMPSILDYVGASGDYVCFGQNLFSENAHPGSAISYLNGIYQLIEGPFVLQFDGSEVSALYNWQEDPLLKNDLQQQQQRKAQSMSRKVKAMIQAYNNRMIRNQLIVP